MTAQPSCDELEGDTPMVIHQLRIHDARTGNELTRERAKHRDVSGVVDAVRRSAQALG
jgi:hypothetical protein